MQCILGKTDDFHWEKMTRIRNSSAVALVRMDSSSWEVLSRGMSVSLKSQAGFSSSSTLYSYWTEWIIFLFKLIPQELYGGVLGTLHSTKTILRYQAVFEWSWMRFMGPVSPNCYQVNAVPRYTGLCLSSRGWSELNVSMSLFAMSDNTPLCFLVVIIE